MGVVPTLWALRFRHRRTMATAPGYPPPKVLPAAVQTGWHSVAEAVSSAAFPLARPCPERTLGRFPG